eukprot:6047859-Pyramimonas_sp.AAC.1
MAAVAGRMKEEQIQGRGVLMSAPVSAMTFAPTPRVVPGAVVFRSVLRFAGEALIGVVDDVRTVACSSKSRPATPPPRMTTSRNSGSSAAHSVVTNGHRDGGGGHHDRRRGHDGREGQRGDYDRRRAEEMRRTWPTPAEASER